MNAENEVITEIATFIFDSRTKIYEIYDFVEKNFAKYFQC